MFNNSLPVDSKEISILEEGRVGEVSTLSQEHHLKYVVETKVKEENKTCHKAQVQTQQYVQSKYTT